MDFISFFVSLCFWNQTFISKKALSIENWRIAYLVVILYAHFALDAEIKETELVINCSLTCTIYLMGKSGVINQVQYIGYCVILTWAWHKASINPGSLKSPTMQFALDSFQMADWIRQWLLSFGGYRVTWLERTKIFHMASIVQDQFTCLLEV